ncbi:MAG TPA: hypothetical protein VEA69_11645 [Tepidisphaeraceae bacterium]|nr:hypothetical protein [Tepidisphaeraceae bacterium]
MNKSPLTPWRLLVGVTVVSLFSATACAPTRLPGPSAAGTASTRPASVGPLFPAGDARRVVFIIPTDGSLMTSAYLLSTLTLDSVDRLGPAQQFNLILLGSDTGRALADAPLPATAANRGRARDFLDKWTAHNGDLIQPLRSAFRMNPDRIFVLANGDDPNDDAVVREVRRLNAARPPGAKVQVHTVGWLDRGDQYEAMLKRIAAENAGTYRFVDDAWVDRAAAEAIHESKAREQSAR